MSPPMGTRHFHGCHSYQELMIAIAIKVFSWKLKFLHDCLGDDYGNKNISAMVTKGWQILWILYQIFLSQVCYAFVTFFLSQFCDIFVLVVFQMKMSKLWERYFFECTRSWFCSNFSIFLLVFLVCYFFIFSRVLVIGIGCREFKFLKCVQLHEFRLSFVFC